MVVMMLHGTSPSSWASIPESSEQAESVLPVIAVVAGTLRRALLRLPLLLLLLSLTLLLLQFQFVLSLALLLLLLQFQLVLTLALLLLLLQFQLVLTLALLLLLLLLQFQLVLTLALLLLLLDLDIMLMLALQLLNLQFLAVHLILPVARPGRLRIPHWRIAPLIVVKLIYLRLPALPVVIIAIIAAPSPVIVPI
jgi:hypothetical protein